MLRSLGKQSGESVVSPEEKKESYGGKDFQKMKVLSTEWNSEGVTDDESGESMEPMRVLITIVTATNRPMRLLFTWDEKWVQAQVPWCSAAGGKLCDAKLTHVILSALVVSQTQYNALYTSRQGCVLSPYLFNILAEMVMRETLDGF